jgi:hypothetical protein
MILLPMFPIPACWLKWSLTDFLPGLVADFDPSFSSSWVAGIIDMSHCVQPGLSVHILLSLSTYLCVCMHVFCQKMFWSHYLELLIFKYLKDLSWALWEESRWRLRGWNADTVLGVVLEMQSVTHVRSIIDILDQKGEDLTWHGPPKSWVCS